MGALRKSARSPGDELGDYYVAALGFIDPSLTPDSPLPEIHRAVERRRHQLLERPLFQVEDELGALNEALHFVQRVLGGTVATAAAPPSAEYIDVDVDVEIAAGGAEPTLAVRWASAMQAAPVVPAPAESATPVRHARTPAAEGDNPNGQPSLFPDATHRGPVVRPARPVTVAAPTPGTTTAADTESHLSSATRSLAPSVAEPRPAGRAMPVAGYSATLQSSPPTKSGYRRRSLQEAMEHARREAVAGAPAAAVASRAQPHRSPAPQPALPETQAWPVAAGLVLIAWQCWLAGAAGWTATRFLTWPRPGLGYELSWPAAGGLILLGLLTAAITGRLVWIGRRRSRRIAALVHLSAAVVALNLTAWWLAAQRLGTLIDGPPAWHVVGLIAVWLALLPVVRLNDLLVNRAGARQPVATVDRTAN